jgi:hypothetical protein
MDNQVIFSIPNEAIDMNIASVMYCLYKIANCPYGDNLDGFLKWDLEQKKAFSELIDRDDDATP